MYNKLIFIGGTAHSGTSLLEYLLSFHSNIVSICDYNNLNSNITFIENETTVFKSYELFNNYIDNIVKSYNITNEYILLKNPDNVYYINEINKYTNNSKIILLIRDAKHTALSLLKRHDNMWPDFTAALNYWVEINNIINNSEYDNIYKLKYEDFVSNITNTLKNIHSFLNLNDESGESIHKYNNLCNKTIDDFPNDIEHVKLRQTQLLTPIYNSTEINKITLTKEQEDIYNKIII
jgi:hypothetical protein